MSNVNNRPFNFTLTIRLSDDDIFWGPGTAELLQNIKVYGSLNAASKAMYLSYSKALKIVEQAEKHLRFTILDRRTGGNLGGGSKLTSNADKFLSEYLSFKKEVEDFAKITFPEHFPGHY